MKIQELSVLAVVPARGGSKSIPRKNLCKVQGVSLVGRAASVIKSIPWITVGVLSTDDKEIAAEGLVCGLEVPFMRPATISGDTATSVDMWKHAWLSSEAHFGIKFDISILLEPTSPLRIIEDVERTVNKLVEEGYTSAITVSPTPAHYTPHKTLTVNNECVNFYHENGNSYSLRQSIPQYYHRNGLCYAVTREHLLNEGQIITDQTAAVIVERKVVNIDEPFELELAEWLLNKRM